MRLPVPLPGAESEGQVRPKEPGAIAHRELVWRAYQHQSIPPMRSITLDCPLDLNGIEHTVIVEQLIADVWWPGSVCEFAGDRCQRLSTHRGFHMGASFGICAKHIRSAKKWYDTEAI